MTDETTTPQQTPEQPDTQAPGHAVDEPGADPEPLEEVAQERTEALEDAPKMPPQAGEVDTGAQAGQVAPLHEASAGLDVYGTGTAAPTDAATETSEPVAESPDAGS